MKKEYIKPKVLVENIETESMMISESGQIGEGLGKDNNNDFAFDDNTEDEYEDDGASWSRPPFLRPRFN